MVKGRRLRLSGPGPPPGRAGETAVVVPIYVTPPVYGPNYRSGAGDGHRISMLVVSELCGGTDPTSNAYLCETLGPSYELVL